MVYLGSLNSRMKDFYDIWRMSQQINFDGDAVCEAIKGTFDNRKTEIMELDNIVAELLDNEKLDRQWTAFLRKSALTGPDTFPEVLAPISDFLSPVFSSINSGKAFDQKWTAPGPWHIDD